MALDRERLKRRASNLKTESVHVPEWVPEGDTDPDDVVIVREMTSKEQDAYNQQIAVMSGNDVIGIDQNNITAKLLVRCIIDESGQRVFPDDAEGAEEIGSLPSSGSVKLMNVVLKLSGMTEEAAKEIEGNSDAVPTGDTESGSPETATTEPLKSLASA